MTSPFHFIHFSEFIYNEIPLRRHWHLLNLVALHFSFFFLGGNNHKDLFMARQYFSVPDFVPIKRSNCNNAEPSSPKRKCYK